MKPNRLCDPFPPHSSILQYVDLTSQAVCANLGHTIPPSIKAAIDKQLDDVPFVYGGLATTQARAKLSQLLSEIFPVMS
jgi:adenosylmethionine-8-amino-7-oxononanoate aminotransferase